MVFGFFYKLFYIALNIMKRTFLIIAFFFCFSNLFSQEIIGSWAGELAVSGTKLPLVFTIKQNGADLITTMDSPMQGAKDLPTDNTSFIDKELRIDAKKFGISYKGKFEHETP